MDYLSSQNPIRVAIEGAPEPRQLLEALNENSGGFVRQYIQQQGLLERLTDQSLRTLVNAAVTVTVHLRKYVGEWVDTGLMENGEEKPLERSLHRAQSLHQLVMEFHRDFPIITRIENFGDPGQVMLCDVGCYSLLRGDRKLPGATQKAGIVWAQSLFIALLLSEWKHRVCLCRRCGKFLMLPRAPRKSGYIRGVNCEACSSAASAVAITARKRKDETDVLVIFAAKHCSALRCNGNPEIIKQRAVLIAEKVTKSLAAHRGGFHGDKRIGKRTCSRKWVVTHAVDLAQEQLRMEAERASPRQAQE
jgi:hypothetical protein